MSAIFECFIEICDQKYDIVIKELGFVVKFTEIYPKIQQMVKIGLKADINFITHKFEVMEFMSPTNEWSLVKSAEQLIKHKSRIRIRRNSQELINYSMANNTIDTRIVNQSKKEELNYLLVNEKRIEGYHSIVMAINIGWDLLSAQNWTKVEDQLKVLKPSLTLKYYDLKNEFHQWSTFYTKNFCYSNEKIGPKSQRVFDLLKVIHVLDFEKVFNKNDPNIKQLETIWLFPSLKDFYNKFLINIRVEKILTKEMKNSGKQTNDKQNQNTINQNSSANQNASIPQKPNFPHISIPSFPNNQNRSVTSVNNQNNHSFIATHNISIPSLPIPSNDPRLRNKQNNSTSNGYQTHRINIPFNRTENLTNDINISLEEKLLFDEENEIKSYSFMALIINIGWNLRGNDDNWRKVSAQLWCHYKKMLNPLLCLENFHRWTEFYAKNYNKLNGRLQPNAQKIFDLLKLVHVLDLDKFYDNTSHIPKQIHEIWLNSELQDYYRKYLKQIHLKKYKEKENISIHTNPIQEMSTMTYTPKSPEITSPQTNQTLINRTNQMSNRNEENSTKRDNYHSNNKRRVSSHLEKQLKNFKDEIKDFYRIVLAINIKWDFRRYPKSWNKVSDTINHRAFDDLYCSNTFYDWLDFYTKNYFDLNEMLEPSLQHIFDMLKVVHTLDLYRFYSDSNRISIKFRSISKDLKLKSYFSKYLTKIRDKKVDTKENDTMVRSQRVSSKHIDAYESLWQSFRFNANTSQSNRTTTNNEKTQSKSKDTPNKSNTPVTTNEVIANCNSVNKKVAQTPSASQSSSTSNCWTTIHKTYERESQNRSGQTSQTLDKNNYNVSSTNNTNKTVTNQSQSTRPSDPRLKRRYEELQTLRSDNNSNNDNNVNKKQTLNEIEVICLD